MVPIALPSSVALPPAPAAGSEDPAKIRDAARQFEALLLAQILRSAHEDGSGWLGSGDSASDCATGLAEQQLARVLAEKGGLGLAQLISAGLQQGPPKEPGAT